MTKDQIQRKMFMSGIKTNLLAVTFNLLDDNNYSKIDAAEDLLKVIAELDEAGETEIVIPKAVTKNLTALVITKII